MCAITRRGQAVLERESCVKCLYVKADFRRRCKLGEMGEEARNGGGEDIPAAGRRYAVQRLMSWLVQVL